MRLRACIRRMLSLNLAVSLASLSVTMRRKTKLLGAHDSSYTLPSWKDLH